jgi:hypothetical protein
VTYAWYKFIDQPALQNLNLTPEQKQSQQSRDNRHLALNRKALGAIPFDARSGAHASFGGALRRPFGLAPSSFVMCNTPV